MDLIKEINDKYLALEAEVDKKLEKVKREEEKLEKINEEMAHRSATAKSSKILSYEEAMARNASLLKSLEMAKARLRSRSTFSPVEQILEKAIANYKRDLEASTSMGLNALNQAGTAAHTPANSHPTNTHEIAYEVLQMN